MTAGRRELRIYPGAIVHLPAGFPHKATNYAIQRTARELLIDTLLRWKTTHWGNAVDVGP